MENKTAKPAAAWTGEETDAWKALVRAQQYLLGAVEDALKQEGLPPLTWYDVLWELERARPAGLRLNDLGKRVLLDKYNVTRLVSRLEKEGLVRRRACPGDGRGVFALITPRGERLRKEMWPVYRATVKKLFLSRFGEREISQIGKLLGRVIENEGRAPSGERRKSD